LKSFDDTQAIFNAQVGHESRLYEMIPSAYNSWLGLYRGDGVGPGQAYINSSADDYQNDFNQRVGQGYFPASLHAAGNSDGSAVYSSIFTKRLDPLPMRWVAPAHQFLRSRCSTNRCRATCSTTTFGLGPWRLRRVR